MAKKTTTEMQIVTPKVTGNIAKIQAAKRLRDKPKPGTKTALIIRAARRKGGTTAKDLKKIVGYDVGFGSWIRELAAQYGYAYGEAKRGREKVYYLRDPKNA